MEGRARISRQGRDIVVHISEDLARAWGVQEGLVVNATTSGDSLVLRKQPFELGKMLERITAENLHGEYDFGKREGGEVW